MKKQKSNWEILSPDGNCCFEGGKMKCNGRCVIGAVVEDDMVKLLYEGEPLEWNAEIFEYCPKCGEKINLGYCPRCGRREDE